MHSGACVRLNYSPRGSSRARAGYVVGDSQQRIVSQDRTGSDSVEPFQCPFHGPPAQSTRMTRGDRGHPAAPVSRPKSPVPLSASAPYTVPTTRKHSP
ncbi:hypothetical protein C8Q73DRAFT_233928 [Cubamyces lactineus]|nr:hypothetical protein C8Q73DRAFT_233928 [Cubamyces lactineus]